MPYAVRPHHFTAVTYFLHLFSDGYGKAVFDVVVEGVSMAITLRSEYSSVIKNQGGLPGLVVLLRDKLAKGEFKPAVAAQ